jgi:hypothetical protein
MKTRTLTFQPTSLNKKRLALAVRKAPRGELTRIINRSLDRHFDAKKASAS